MLIGIIGSAGRRADGPKMTRRLYFNVVDFVHEVALADIEIKDRTLKSGGAAWIDNAAVTLFNRRLATGLHLEFPALWLIEHNRFVENDTKSDPGRTANYYHDQFTSVLQPTRWSSQEGIGRAIQDGALFSCRPGFHARNLEVGKVDRLLAFTWGEGNEPSSSGTSHTWRHSPAPDKRHFCLEQFR